MTICEYCGSNDIVKKGFRHNASGRKQKFFCHGCEKWFVHDDGFKRMRIKPEHIVRALHEYADGASLKKVRVHLSQHDNVKVTRWAIRKWVVKYSHLLKKTRRDSALRRLRGEYILTKSKFVLAELVVRERTLKACLAFLLQIKNWCYKQMLDQYNKELKKPIKKKKLIIFVSDKFGNYKVAWKKLFYRVTKLKFGVPMACKKFGLMHNNNSVERHNRKLSRRFDTS